MVREDRAFVVERTLLERERAFESGDDLRAARMTGEAIDIFESQSAAGQNAGDRRCDVRLREWRNRPVEYDAEALRIDSPTHDVECVGPGVLTAHLNGGGAAVVSLEHAGGRTVPEQRRGDDVSLGQFIEAEGEGANLDRDQQHNAARA